MDGNQTQAADRSGSDPAATGADEEFDLDRIAELAREEIETEAEQKRAMMTAVKQFERLPLVAVGTSDGRVVAYDPNTNRVLGSFPAHATEVVACRYLPAAQ